MEFEWDENKAADNLRKHKVSFAEAATVFADRLGATVSDPDHSAAEDRLITIGLSIRSRLLIVSHRDFDDRIRSSALVSSRDVSGKHMKKKENAKHSDELREEYGLKTLLKGAVRGKYAERYREGTNLVLLEPEVAQAFPSTKAVNEALKLVMKLQKVPMRKRGRKAG